MSEYRVKPSMFVVGVVFNNSFIIHNFYELLPIVPIVNFNFIKGDTLPYFGIDSAIVSLVPKIENGKGVSLKPRGVRRVESNTSSSAFGNSVTIDFQSHNKNVCIRASSSEKCESKFHITGLTSYKMAEEVTYKLLSQFKITELMWKPFFILRYEEKMAFLNKIYNLIDNNGSMLRYGNKIIHDKIEEMKDELGELYNCTNLILRYTLEDETMVHFGNRLMRIINLNTGVYSIFHDKDDFKVLLFDIYNGVYNGKISNIYEDDIYLTYITDELLKLGFKCGFCNVARTEITILIPIVNEIHYNSKGKTKEKGHLFKVKLKGSVELYSKGNPTEAQTIGTYVINVIEEIINSNEYKSKFGIRNSDPLQSMYANAIQNLAGMTFQSDIIPKKDNFINQEFENIDTCEDEYF